MADFRTVISDPQTGKSYQVEVTGSQANKFLGKKLGETIEGSAAGLAGYSLKITGGTDKDGFPLRKDLPGSQRRKLLLSKSTGFKPKVDGLRKRKTVRGRDISGDVGQINLVVAEYGKKTIEEIFAPSKEETPEASESVE